MNLTLHLGRFSWAVATRLLPLVNGLAFILFVIPALPVEEFGRYSIIFAIASQVIFVNKTLILNPMIKFASEPGRHEAMARTGFGLNALFYLAAGLLLILVAPLLGGMLKVERSDIYLAAAFLPLFFLRDWSFCVHQTLYRMKHLFLLDAIYYLGSAGGYFYLRQTNAMQSALDPLLVNFIAALASSLAVVPLGGLTNLLRRIAWGEAKELLRYGVLTLGIGLSSSLVYGADLLLLGAIYNPAIVGVYGGAKNIYRVVSALTAAMGVLVMPYASRLAATGNRAELGALFEKATAYVVIGLGGFAMLMMLAAEPFFRLFMGASYLEAAPLLRIMMLAAPFEGLFNVTGTILYGIGAAGAVAAVSGVSLMVMAILLPAGVYFYAGYGAAIALAATLATAGLLMFRRGRQEFDSPVSAIVRRLLQTAGHFLARKA
ncbi:MAG: hypothetical protein FJY67_09840 [Calditrichaeota bacterium]|nr:hypothetical protein [Calditrichota bacterium]